MTSNTLLIQGSGGGKKQKTPVEQEVSFTSKAIAYLAVAYSEGETGGLVDAGKSIFFDDTPLENADGTVNYPGVTWEQRYGLPNQTPVPDFTQPGSVRQINVQLRAASPFVRGVNADETDHVTAVIRFNGLQKTNDNGDQNGTEVSFRVEKMDTTPTGANVWETEVSEITVKGRVISPYEVEIPITRPVNSTGAWQYRITRLTPDSTSTKVINDTTVSYVTERDTTAGNITQYNNTAYVALRIDTSLFGDQIPTVSFRVNGVKVRVPDNYNPVTRAYAGVWQGGFQYAVTDNPAWHIYNLIVDGRYGLGMNSAFLNKFDFYTMAKYCDEMVPDGLGTGGTRPRFTLRTQINDSSDAVSLINSICSAMRAGPYWGAGSVQVTQDAPKAVSKIANQTNVIDGAFIWKGTELADRATTAYITWNDPADFFRPRITKYEDAAAVQKYGAVNERKLAKYGCANEHEAIAFGKYLVDSSLNETQIVAFTGSMEFADARPGDIIEVADPMRSKSRMGGRVGNNGTTQTNLVLDAPMTLAAGHSYRVIYNQGDQIYNVAVTSPAGTRTSVALASPIPFEVGHPFILAGTDIQPVKVRVLSVREEDGRYAIVAQEYDETKYLRTEQGIIVPPPVTSRYTDKSVRPPGEIKFRDVVEIRNGEHVRVLTAYWDPSPSEWVIGYTLQWRRESLNFSPQAVLQVREFEILNPRDGLYDFVVSSINGNGGAESPPVLASYLVGSRVPGLMPAVTGLRLTNSVDPNGTEFRTPAAEFAWNHQSAAVGEFGSDPTADGLDAEFLDYQIKVIAPDFSVLRVDYSTSNTWVYTLEMNLADRRKQGFTTPTRNFTVEVKQRGRKGQISDEPARLTVSNPPPALPTGVDVEGFFRFVRLTHDPLTADAIGTIIWLSKTANFEPGPENRAYEGIGTIHDIEAETNTQYYLKFAIYDTFSQSDLLISPEFPVKTLNSEVNFADPAIPTGLVLTTTDEIQTDGTLRVRLIANWDDAAANSDTTWWEVEIKEGSGTPVVFPTNSSRYEIDARPNTLYTVRVRAVNVVTFSQWSASKTTTSSKDTTIPGRPTSLLAAAAFKTVFLRWSNAADLDLDHVEIYESSTNNRTAATVIARVASTSYTRSGLSTNETKYYWIRSVDLSGNVSEFEPVSPTAGIPVTTSKIAGGPDIEANSITTNLLKSTEVWADIIQTDSLDAAKIKANTILSDSIKVGSNSLANLSTWATDPATRINLNTVKINPGQILIAGSTTLAHWAKGGDVTKIDGAMISTGTVKANVLEVGSRAVTFSIQFQHNNASVVSWGNGTVTYPDNDGTVKTSFINAGSATWNGSTQYIIWTRGTNALTWTTNPATATADRMVVATYGGGSFLIVNYGKTLVDGADIKTGTVTASNIQGLTITAAQIATSTITGNKLAFETITGDRISGGTITGNKIAGNTITGGHIIGGTITGGHISGQTINAGHLTAGTLSANNIETGSLKASTYIQVGNNLIIDGRSSAFGGTEGRIYINDPRTGRNRLWMGHIPGDDYGIIINDYNGVEIFSARQGLNGAYIRNLLVDTLQIKGNAVTVPVVGSSGRRTGLGGFVQAVLVYVNMPQPGHLFVSASIGHSYPSGTRSYEARIRVDGTDWTARHAGTGSYDEAPSIMASRFVGAGNHSVELIWNGQNSGIVMDDAALFAMGAMR